MNGFNLCPPALIYLVFSIIQIVIDIGQGFYNTALAKVVVSLIFSVLLNYLCLAGLGIVSWIIIFVPFILMSVVISVLLYVLGLKPTSGRLQIYKNGQTHPHHGRKPHHPHHERKPHHPHHPHHERKPHHPHHGHHPHHKDNEQGNYEIKYLEEEIMFPIHHKKSKSSKSEHDHHHHPHSHDHKNKHTEEHNKILHKIKKDRKVKKNKKEVKPHHFKHNKKRHERIEHDNEDLDNNNKYDEMTEKEINKSIDSMLKQLKHKYD